MNTPQAIEALLFTAGRALSKKKLAKLIDVAEEEITKAIEQLQATYKERAAGLAVVENETGVELVSSPDAADVVANYLKDESTGELTRPSLETLTIVAYRGPVTKSEIELIRGVNCSLILRNLRMRGLIEETVNDHGLEEYSVSLDTLKFLGVSKTSELPNFEHLSADERLQDLLDNEGWFKSDS